MGKKSTKYQILQSDFEQAKKELKFRREWIEELKDENAKLRYERDAYYRSWLRKIN